MSRPFVLAAVARSTILCFVALACSVSTSLSAVAQTPGFATERVRLPPNPANTKGYTVDFVWDRQTLQGYASVEIRVTSTSTFAADRRIVVRLQSFENGYSPRTNGMTIDMPIQIQQGKSFQTVTRSFPKWFVGNGYQLRLFDDGVEREKYRVDIGDLVRPTSRPTQKGLLAETKNDWLMVARAENASTMKPFVNGRYPLNVAVSNSRTTQSLPAPVTRHSAEPSALPTDWRALQVYDAVVIEQAELQRIAKELPDRFATLRDWVFCGGTLIVFNAESLASITSDLQVTESSTPVDQAVVRIAYQAVSGSHRSEVANLEAAIKAVELQRRSTRGMSQAELDRMRFETSEVGVFKMRLKALQVDTPDPKMMSRIWSQLVGGGRLIGISRDSQLDSFDLSVVARTFGYRQSPTLRRGVDPMLGDERAKRWLIPGVAQPPVYTFMGLLTVFVILVGPVAYRKTTKSGRGYLMFAIAPVLALLTTAMMLIYGVVADGFGTQTRVRQLTWVDGASGDAGERIRGTYFSGVRPVDGIRFGGQDEVMAYPDLDQQSWEELNRRNDASLGRVVVTEDGQQFDNNFLPSRAQTQFVVHRPNRGLGRLRIASSKKYGSQPTLTSEFDFALRNVIVRSHDGDYLLIDELAANESEALCKITTASEASKVLSRLYTDNRAISATREMNPNSYQYSNRTRDLVAVFNRHTGDPSRLITDGTFEFWLQQNLQVAGDLPNGHFVALADASDDAIWVDGAESFASIRFVFGTLP